MRVRTTVLVGFALLSGLSAGAALVESDEAEPPWEEILRPAEVSWPAPLAEVVWRSDLVAARAEAERTGRPLFVTARCLPCKQCATFDQDLLEGGAELSPLLSQFVTVRLTDAKALDVELLASASFQDFDLSWWGWFLSPTGSIYGIFGGRDDHSDTTRISTAALARTLRRVLDHHYDDRRTSWGLGRPAASEARTPLELPGHSSWSEQHPEARDQACLHCHQVAEIVRQPAIDAGSFDPRTDVDVWPLPENVGLTLERDDGLLITAVAPEGPAAAIGLQPGDRLGAAAGQRLFGQADLRGVLHREADPEGSIELVWTRAGEVLRGRLELAVGWRRTVLDWRMSISQGNVGPAPGFPFPLRGPRDVVEAGSMSVSPFFGRGHGQGPAWDAGLRPGHVIVAVDGESPDLHGRAFLVWFRLNHEAGQEVCLTVLEDGERRELRYTLTP